MSTLVQAVVGCVDFAAPTDIWAYDFPVTPRAISLGRPLTNALDDSGVHHTPVRPIEDVSSIAVVEEGRTFLEVDEAAAALQVRLGEKRRREEEERVVAPVPPKAIAGLRGLVTGYLEAGELDMDLATRLRGIATLIKRWDGELVDAYLERHGARELLWIMATLNASDDLEVHEALARVRERASFQAALTLGDLASVCSFKRTAGRWVATSTPQTVGRPLLYAMLFEGSPAARAHFRALLATDKTLETMLHARMTAFIRGDAILAASVPEEDWAYLRGSVRRAARLAKQPASVSS
jgi:hypothetical protein